ncbi:hypothetical protein D3OALGA1CA_2080 [Olavius algarvensis associated proteobacterium Delta 3]|nr:hypothetical protein D3OALGA1CA_2080 [Olavius algarvensis associated proteobacterium Delta 3]CAB5120827.1 hypothetical protein D3OALGB2SA_2974 [Olavius algarvensis associated proteobacterium Delta 3]
MEEWSQNRYLRIFVLVVMAGIVFGVFYRAYNWPAGQSMRPPDGTYKDASPKKTLSPIKNNTLTLLRGRPVTVWKKKLVYHGLESDRIHIAVYILELDPEVPYHHRIPVRDAKKGIRLGGQAFDLVGYGKNRIQLGIKGDYRED